VVNFIYLHSDYIAPALDGEITNLRYFGIFTHFNWKNTVAQHENSSNLIIGQRFHDFA
jgi:hypothetical protein